MNLNDAINEAMSSATNNAVSVFYPKPDIKQQTTQQFINQTIEYATRQIVDKTIYQAIIKKINVGLNRTISIDINETVADETVTDDD